LPLVQADQTQIAQILVNLLKNSMEAIGESPGSIRVSTRFQSLNGHGTTLLKPAVGHVSSELVCLEVKDNGCGMDEATQHRICDPFFSTKLAGRGLGLAAVQGIVRSHNGALKVVSAPQQGTVVQVFLPAE
jgi:signal transduction histidine kinase